MSSNAITVTEHDLQRHEGFRIVRAADIPDSDASRRWLLEGIWSEQGVGIIGGAPKTRKTFLICEAGVAVATGTPFLGAFEVPQAGPVLMYIAEDHLGSIKERLSAAASQRGLPIADVNVQLIDAPRLHLDNSRDFLRLEDKVRAIRPRLLVLDPFVRVFQGNEDDSGQVSRVLGLLRKLQRQYEMAIMLVHHARKGATAAGGSMLRGSGDLHAWGDSNLYVRAERAVSTITVEHRAAQAPEPFRVRLVEARAGGPALELVAGEVEQDQEDQDDSEDSLEVEIENLLRASSKSLGLTEIQTALHRGRTRISAALAAMVESGTLEKEGKGYRLRTVPPPT